MNISINRDELFDRYQHCLDVMHSAKCGYLEDSSIFAANPSAIAYLTMDTAALHLQNAVNAFHEAQAALSEWDRNQASN